MSSSLRELSLYEVTDQISGDDHVTSQVLEVFVNNTNLTFLTFLYKISIEVS